MTQRDMTRAEKPMTRGEALLFATADLWGGGGQTLIAVLYLTFLTNVLGISPGLAGTALLLAKIWDAIIDPFLGLVADRTRTRLGRRRPYLILGAPLLLLSMAVFWYPFDLTTDTQRFFYILINNMIYATIASMVSLSYSSMSSEISRDYVQTSRLNLLRLVFSMTGTALATLLPTRVFSQLLEDQIPFRTFYITIVLGFGLLFTVPIFLAGIFCRERVDLGTEERPELSARELFDPLKLRSLRLLIGTYLCQAVTMDTVSAIAIYYALYVIPGLSSTIFLACFMIAQLLLLPYFRRKIKDESKSKLYRQGLPLAILGAALLALYPAHFPVWGVYVCTVLTALGFAGATTLNWVIYPDIVDIGELITGTRQAGSFSALMTFTRQMSSALTIFLVGQILQLAGFIPAVEGVNVASQPGSVLIALRLIIGLTFFLFSSLAIVLTRKMDLEPQVSQEIKELLEKQRSGEALTAVEIQRKEGIIERYQ